jgi:hypothetical protein
MVRSIGLWKTFKDVVKNERVKGLWMGTIPVCFLNIKMGCMIREVPMLERGVY